MAGVLFHIDHSGNELSLFLLLFWLEGVTYFKASTKHGHAILLCGSYSRSAPVFGSLCSFQGFFFKKSDNPSTNVSHFCILQVILLWLMLGRKTRTSFLYLIVQASNWNTVVEKCYCLPITSSAFCAVQPNV